MWGVSWVALLVVMADVRHGIGMWQILFKSRCDNQLNEVKESVATERREVCTLVHPSVYDIMCRVR